MYCCNIIKLQASKAVFDTGLQLVTGSAVGLMWMEDADFVADF
jgi:hypothetical protein